VRHQDDACAYALLCRAIELELKSKHLKKAHEPGGPRQDDIADKYGHDLRALYKDLPFDQKVLSPKEMEVLHKASEIYNVNKGFDYITPHDAGTGFKRFPDLPALDAVAKQLLGIT
jgi:hypothetical protein